MLNVPAIGVAAVLLMIAKTIPDALTPRTEIPDRDRGVVVTCHPSGRHLIGPDEMLFRSTLSLESPLKVCVFTNAIVTVVGGL